MEIVPIKLIDLINYAGNPRKNEAAVDKVTASIKEFGFRMPIVIDRDNVIVAGHTRVMAAARLKLTEVPCIVADDLTEEQVNAYRLADNKVAEFSEWDYVLRAEELADITNIDMSQFGFLDDIDESEIDDMIGNFQHGLNREEQYKCPKCGKLFSKGEQG